MKKVIKKSEIEDVKFEIKTDDSNSPIDITVKENITNNKKESNNDKVEDFIDHVKNNNEVENTTDLVDKFNETKEYKILHEKIKKNKKHKKLVKKHMLLIVSLFVIWSILLLFIGYALNFDGKTASNFVTKQNEIIDMLSDDWFYFNQDENVIKSMQENALYGMTTFTQDPYTTYLSKEDIESFTTSVNNNFVGIGVQFLNVNDYSIITNVFDGSPAGTAGIIDGDIISKIDDTVTLGLTQDDIKKLVSGVEGSTVNIEVKRGSEILTFSVTRGNINTTVESAFLSDNQVGYVKIYTFGETTGQELRAHLDNLVANNIDKIIFDVRDNSGGYLTSLVDVAGTILPKDSVAIKEVYPDGTEKVFTTKDEPVQGINKIVILINEQSASAAEAFTLAIDENFVNTEIIGTTSLGKGTVQVTKMFNDGSALKYTTAKWASSLNNSLENFKGIVPDIVIESQNSIGNKVMQFEEGLVIDPGQENPIIEQLQIALQILGYQPDRIDGYFSVATLNALNNYQTDRSLNKTTDVTKGVFMEIIAETFRELSVNTNADVQLTNAIDFILHS